MEMGITLSKRLKGHSDWITRFSWSPNGKLFAAGADDHKVVVWDSKSGNTINTFERHFENISGVTWSPDSSRLASSSEDGVIFVWDPYENEPKWLFIVRRG